jgi:hypothetical protein
MVERVARAICVSEGAVDPDGSFEGVAHWERYDAEARAAIEAMREPTEAMMQAVTDFAVQHDLPWWWDETIARSEGSLQPGPGVWSVMIDAALSTPDRIGGRRVSEPSDDFILAVLKAAASSGAGEGDLGALLAGLRGERMVVFEEYPRRGKVHVKVSRVHAVSEHHVYGQGRNTLDGDRTVLHFNGLEPGHPKERLVVDRPMHKVIRDLREAGWPY